MNIFVNFIGYFVFEILYGDRFVFLFFIYILELDI